ncbi:MAG: isoprenyl transferase [Bdellovibrionaceae bacterium]|nr:isoprenyl transferase [Pseudobdellovibrionaceae bacterium]
MKKLNHVAIIMDGNGRWAQLRNKPRTFGHIKGARIAKKIITHASDIGLKYMTLYTFSSENWLRPVTEVSFLMTLLERYIKKETENLFKKNIKFTVIGEIEKLPAHIQSSIQYAKNRTQNCTGLEVCFAISYGSRQEITNAVKKIARQVSNGEIQVSEIDEAMLNGNLMTCTKPDPDLVIRTSGEYRLSNFLMWQCAYSEFFFSDTLWPDFTTVEFDHACNSYHSRNRRFGKIESSVHAESINY